MSGKIAKLILISLSCLTLLGCPGTLGPDPVVRECRFIVAVPVENSYFFCTKTDGTGPQTRVFIKDLPTNPQDSEQLYVGLPYTDYLVLKKRQKEVEDFISKNCKGK